MNICIFDLNVTGHHPGYMRQLLRYWPAGDDVLTLVVAPDFLIRHADVVETQTEATVRWWPVTPAEAQQYEASKQSMLRHTWVEWRLFCRYAKRVDAAYGLVMYLDRFQLPLASRLPAPCAIGGIYFRPAFHYQQLSEHSPNSGEARKAMRQRILWRAALRHPKLKTIFSLDPLAVPSLNQLGNHQTAVVHLPDPVELYPASETPLDFKTEAGRKLFLLFGMLTPRKGIFQVLEAVQQLSAENQQKLTLMLAGPLPDPHKDRVLEQIAALERNTCLQIILHNAFISDADVQRYFAAADIILAPYQHHVGMSAILVRAAAAQRPVLSSDYGLMGHLVRQHQLGATVDSTQPAAIATKISDILQGKVCKVCFDRDTARVFADGNSAEKFTLTIHNQLIYGNERQSI